MGSPDRTETPNTLPAGPTRRSASGPQDHSAQPTTQKMRSYRCRIRNTRDGGARHMARASGSTVAVKAKTTRHAGPVRRQLRRHGTGRQHPRQGPDLRAPLDPPGRPSLRRDHLGVPDRRHRQRIRQDRSSSRRTSRSPTSGPSSRPTSSCPSTSAATSAPRSARPPSASSSTASSTRSRPGRRPSTTSRPTRTSRPSRPS